MSGAYAEELGRLPKDQRSLSVDHYESSTSILARKHRVLFLKGLIVGYPGGGNMGRSDHHSAAGVFMDIMAMNREDPSKPITLVINSEGGVVEPGLQLYDVIRLSKAPITTIGINCASMATILLVAGNERLAFPHSRFMLHLLSGGARGELKDVEIAVKELRKIQTMLTDCYIECGVKAGLRTKNKETIRKRLMKDVDDGDFWLNAEEAVKYGLVDRIVEPKDLYGG